MSLWRLFFDFQGRIRRQTYWGAWFVQIALTALAGFVIDVWFPVGPDGQQESAVGTALWWVAFAVALWSSLAVQVKRWHDREKNGLWVLINLIPILGGVWALVENGFLDGTQGPNRFGPSRKGIGEIPGHLA